MKFGAPSKDTSRQASLARSRQDLVDLFAAAFAANALLAEVLAVVGSEAVTGLAQPRERPFNRFLVRIRHTSRARDPDRMACGELLQ